MLTYSVKPRGGVVHALEVSEALARRGHEVELMALARPGEALFRPTARARCGLVRHVPTDAPFDERIQAMLDAYTEGLRRCSATAASTSCTRRTACRPTPRSTLRDEGVDRPRDPHRAPRRRLHLAVAGRVPGPLDPRARPRAVRLASRGSSALAREFGVRAGLVRNGVDTAPLPAAARRAPSARATARRAGLGDRFTVLTVGGIEPRKGSLTLLEGFAAAARARARARPAAADRRRHDAVRLPPRARALRRARATSSASASTCGVLGALEPRRARAAVPRRRRVRVPVGQGGLRARRARGAGRRAAGRRLRPRRVPRTSSTHERSALLAPAGDAGALARGAGARRARRRRCASGCAPAGRRGRPTPRWDAVGRRARARLQSTCGSRRRSRLMAERLEVSATWNGGYEAASSARGHADHDRRAGRRPAATTPA